MYPGTFKCHANVLSKNQVRRGDDGTGIVWEWPKDKFEERFLDCLDENPQFLEDIVTRIFSGTWAGAYSHGKQKPVTREQLATFGRRASLHMQSKVCLAHCKIALGIWQ